MKRTNKSKFIFLTSNILYLFFTLSEMKHKIIFFLILFLVQFSCKNAPEISLEAQTATQSSDYFHTTTQTLVSAHRGGSGIKNYPENALETIQYLHEQGISVFEIDLFQTSDNKIMLFHDNHLERTTTGNGSLNGKSSHDLLKLKLVDDFGNKTNYKIPFLEDVLIWAKNSGAFLMLDFKDSAKYEDVIALVRKNDMQDNCVLISYSVGQAKKQHRLAPEMLISVSTRNEKELDRILDTDIPTNKMIAFTGTMLSDAALYKRLNDMNIPAILGTLGNLDRRAAARKENMYKKWADLGIQIIATDRPLEAYKALK